MNTFVRPWSVIAMVLGAGLAFAAEPPDNPIQSQLFPPELLMQYHEELGLTEPQMTRVREHLEKAGAAASAAQKKLEAATLKLGNLLGKEAIDEPAAVKQLDEVLDAEREVKRLHLQVMIRIKNELTPKQQRLLAEKTKQAPRADELRERLHGKLTRIQKEVERRAAAGQPPEEAIKWMETFPEHMRSGKHKEAEAVLDRVLKLLDLNEGKKGQEKKGEEKKGEEKKDSEKAGDEKKASDARGTDTK